MTEKLATEKSEKILYDEDAYLIFQKLQNGFADLVLDESTKIVLDGPPVEGTENTYRVTAKDVQKGLDAAIRRMLADHLGRVCKCGSGVNNT